MSDPFTIAKAAVSATTYVGGRRLVFNDLQFKDNFTDWVVSLDLTFCQATRRRTYHMFATYLEDSYKLLPKSPSTLSYMVRERWFGDAGRRLWLKEQFHLTRSKIQVSTDTWTSEEGTNYLSMVAQFLDGNSKLQTALLDLSSLKGSQSGENIAQAIIHRYRFYELAPRLGFFMMDNARNNGTCIEELSGRYSTVNHQARLRCVGHMLNPIVRAFLFGQGVSKLKKELRCASDNERFEIWRKQSSVGKLHNFSVWINRSDQRREGLKRYILQAYREGSVEHLYTRALVDGGIRWNSTYTMIVGPLKLRHAIDLFFHNYKHQGDGYFIDQDHLTPQDWVDLDHFVSVLKPFKDLSKRMESSADKAG